MNKRILLTVAALCLVLAVLPTKASAAVVDSGEWGQDGSDVTWSLDSSGKLTISGTGKMTDCYWVSENQWFRVWDDHMEEITAVVIEEGITYIGEFSWQDAPNLESVTIANSVKEIGRSAFVNCDKLTSISFGTGLTSTGIEVFYDCDGLETVTLPNVNVEYGNNFFGECDKLKNVTIPANQTTIGEAMFEDCVGLTQITIPNTVKSIEGSAFAGCTGLKSITIPNSITEIKGKTFQYCNALSSVSIPDSVTAIGDYAFDNCQSLKSITLPAKLQEMGSDVFSSCTNLSAVTIPATVIRMRHTFENAYGLETIKFMGHAPSCASNLFGNITVTVYYPSNFDSWTEEFRQDYGGNVTWVSFVSDADPGEIRATGSCGENVSWTLKYDGTLIISGTGPMENMATQSAWYEYEDKVKAVEIQEGVTTIGNDSFYENNALERISIPNTVTTIGSNSFFRCYSLKKVQIPDSVQEIYYMAFDQCTGLTEVIMGNGVTTIGHRVFQECTSLSKVNLSENLTQLDRNLFYNCSSLTKIQLPASLTEIPMEMFSGTGLKEIVIPSGVTNIDGSAFYNCSALTKIHFDGLVPPVIAESSFIGVTATAYYPVSEAWTEDKLQDYGGTLTWVPYHVHNFDNAVPVFDPESKTHSWACADCGEKKNESCTFDSVILKEATMTEPGIREYTCTVCGGSYQESVIYRLSGSNRYDTAFCTADALKDALGVQTFDNIVVAYGQNFADALAGSYLATELDAPILLTEDSAHRNVTNYIKENLSANGKVYILGGENSISASFSDGLSTAGISWERLSGSNRYLTNLEILAEAGLNGRTILVCDGNNFADSLSASAANLPILLVGSNLSPDQKDYLSKLTGCSFRIIGGPNSVSESIAEALKAYGTVDRISGSTREETSAKVAEIFCPDPDTVTLAYSRNFPDGLCGGPLAYQLGAPLILVNSGAESFAADYVADNEITSGIILGGTSSIPDDVANVVFPQ